MNELINETDYNTEDVKKQMAANLEKVKQILSGSKDPAAIEALKILKQNDKLLNRKDYFSYTEDEKMLKAHRGNEKHKRDVDSIAGGIPEVAKRLAKEYEGKTFNTEYDSITINKIKYYYGGITVRGTMKSEPYNEMTLTPYYLKQFPQLKKLATAVEKFEERSYKRIKNFRY